MREVYKQNETTTYSGTEACSYSLFPDFREGDISDPEFLARCFQKMAKAGLMKNSRHNLVTLFAAASCARRLSKGEPSGLLVHMLSSGNMVGIRDQDEDWASVSLSGLGKESVSPLVAGMFGLK